LNDHLTDSLISIRPLTPSELPLAHTWNEANTPHVNHLDFSAFTEVYALSTQAYLILCDEIPAGFAWLMGPQNTYESTNYRYFASHMTDFLYLDRMVISNPYRGKGLATSLYHHIASLNPGTVICCEVNIEPPNIASTRLHQKIGFKEVGQQSTEGGRKKVSLLVWDAK